MFEWLSEFDKVLVTGPQRSGTRICAKMIAQDTGFEYVDENDLHMDSLYTLWSLMETKHHLVIQCPVMCRYVHMFKEQDIAVVMLRRNLVDILASQRRIHWRWEWLELARYDHVDGVIAEVKYQFWEQYQKKQIQHAFEVEYECLASHPLWMAGKARQDFKPSQTAPSVQFATLDQNFRPVAYSAALYVDKLDQGSVILIKSRDYGKLLNATGQFIWNLCDGTHTREDILRLLKTEFTDIDEEVLRMDLINFISDLVAADFLRLLLPD